MNRLELKSLFDQQPKGELSLDVEKIQAFAALVVSADKIMEIIRRAQHLNVFQKFNLENALDRMIEESLGGGSRHSY